MEEWRDLIKSFLLQFAYCLLLGFLQYNGMHIEEFIKAWIKSEILMPTVLKFERENLYYEMLKLVFERLKREGMKRWNKSNVNS